MVVAFPLLLLGDRGYDTFATIEVLVIIIL